MHADLTLLQMPWPLHLALWPEQKVHGVPPLQLLVADGLVPLHLLSDTCSQAQLLHGYTHCNFLGPLHLLSGACRQESLLHKPFWCDAFEKDMGPAQCTVSCL